ncbi:LysR family transcriptional regulator [Marinibaculum pumilum]|uniref:LysR family transcriptional regulator n=1 Tax=Marinibaculum pumilum TaxID=1766165 RepID=A0ABV7KYL6_9PROT
MKHLRTLRHISEVAKTGSIRKTAERMNLTPSALTRKIQDFEQELGTEIFERMAGGVRPNAAGELLLRHIREQISDFDRLRSQIADLSGMRRGHVAIACSQAFAHHFIPHEIARYREQFPQVSFEVRVIDHREAVAALHAHEVDLALVLQPPAGQDFQALVTSAPTLCAMMAAGHPLAGAVAAPGAETEPGPDLPVRLRDCLRYPLILPDRSTAGRYLFEIALRRAGMEAEVAVTSNSFEFVRSYLLREPLIGFQVMSGLPPLPEQAATGLVFRQVDRRDAATATLALGQLRGRSLSVAAAKFAEQVSRSLDRDNAAGG